MILEQLDEKLNAIFMAEPKIEKKEKDTKYDNPNDIKKYSPIDFCE